MKVQVNILFSRNKLIGSRMISWGSKHLYPEFEKTPSHVALLINGRWVHESTIKDGVKITSYHKWLEKHEEVANIYHSFIDYQYLKKTFRFILNSKYDWLGVLYLSYHMLLSKLFNKQIPKKNKFENPEKFFCSEVLRFILFKNLSMKSPVQILKDLHSETNIN